MEYKTTGTMHGSMIQLNSHINLSEGKTVEVTVRPLDEPSRTWGDGILRSAGGWQQYPEMDEVMARIHEQRKVERRVEAP